MNKEQRHEYYLKNGERIRASNKRWRDKNRKKCRELEQNWRKNNFEKYKFHHWENQLKRLLGITAKEYDVLFNAQGGVCAICGGRQSTKGRTRLDVDHDHNTKKVRGLLCSGCNRGIGAFKDSPDLLAKAISYLLRFQ